MMNNFKKDFLASIAVFLVALPLCLGIALASGAPLISGVIAGIVGGIIVGAVSNSNLGVSGPAAGLVAVVIYAIDLLQSFEALLLSIVISGILQIIFGMVKLGQIRHYFPSPVIKGMMSGIGIVIILKQIPHLIGFHSDPEGDLSYNQVNGHNTLNELFYMLDNIDTGALIISCISIFILLTWNTYFNKIKFLKIMPASLFVVAIGIFFTLIFQGISSLSLNIHQLVAIGPTEHTSNFLSHLLSVKYNILMNPNIYIVGITIAIIGSLETLLCLDATDKLDPKKRKTSANRELIAQGIGNIFSGILGGLPITQVIVRSSANIQAKGTSKLSTILHGILLFFFVIYLSDLLNLIPIASLASILLIVGFKLSDWKYLKNAYFENKTRFLSFTITVAGIVFSNLLAGILLGYITFHALEIINKNQTAQS